MIAAGDAKGPYTLRHEGVPVATLTPFSPSWKPAAVTVAAGERFVLSRFAFLRRYAGALCLESPLAHARITLHEPAAALPLGLSEPRCSEDLARLCPALSPATIEALLALLAGERIVCHVSTAGVTEEDEEPALVQWEFHDLLFHARSRPGRHDEHYGATARYAGVLAPLPAVKPAMSPERIILYRPDLALLARQEPPFTRVLEERRSERVHGEASLAVARLGEFLYRVARVRRLVAANPERTTSYEYSSRPYPSAGAAYPLDLYLAVDRCDGLAAGLYHYEPYAHVLEVLRGNTPDVEQLLDDARYAAGLQARPQILIVLAARFQRVAWKYGSIAYALLLKDAGVLLQTMYLVATAMRLAGRPSQAHADGDGSSGSGGVAGCALGYGNPDLFARAAGTDYLVESSVGEFMLGSTRPPC